MKKKFFLLSLMFAAAITASATITKTIGTGGTYDYASLHDACMDLYANPLTDDCIWEICTDLTETINTGIINNTNYSLTIRPNAAEDRLIKYTTSADNEGPSGNFVIGGIPKATQAVSIPFATEPAKNVTIDGSYNGDGIRHLTFQGTSVGGRVMVVYGNVTNTFIKNCVIRHTRTSGTTYALEIRSEKNTDNHPVNVLVDNCYLEVIGVANAQTVCLNGSQSSTAAGKPENTTLRNCEIVANLRGVFFNGATNANFEGCTFRLPSASAGFLAHGIMGNAQAGVINVKGCKFLELKTNNTSDTYQGQPSTYGLHGITASGGATVWNIENNIFTGLDALASGATSKHIELCAIRCGDSCVIRHNTFVMPTLTHAPATDLVETRVVGLLWLAGDKKYPVENNIFISHETVANNSLIRGALNENCAHNVFYHDGGNAAIIAGAAIVTDEAGLATADPTSKWKAVTFDSNMMLDGASITDNDLAVAQVAGITTDILGNTRNNPTYAGAEDPDQLTGFTHHLYEIGDNQGWDPVNSPELTMVEPNVFEGTFNFTADNSYFAFTTVRPATEDWTNVNSHRYGGASANLVTDGSVQELTYGGEYSLTIAPGTYKFRVDLNETPAKVYVEGYLYEIGNNIGWNLENHVAMTKVADNVYEKEFVLTEDLTYMAFTRCSSTTDWDAVNAARYATGVYQERLDDGSEEVLVKGDGNATITLLPGVYTVRVDFNTNKVTVAQSAAKVIVGEAGYATYYKSNKAYVMPTGMNGYVFNLPGGLGEIAYAAGETVEAGRALVLEAAAGTYDLVFTDPVAPKDLASQLHGSDAAGMTDVILPGSYVYYGLSLAQGDDPATVGFYYMATDGAAFENGAHKAFLALPAGTPAPERILFHNNDATNIENVEGQEKAVKFIQNGQIFIRKDGVVYDAMGRVIR